MTEFIRSHPWLTFILAWIAIAVAGAALQVLFRCITIWVRGYPPEYCDSEGRQD